MNLTFPIIIPCNHSFYSQSTTTEPDSPVHWKPSSNMDRFSSSSLSLIKLAFFLIVISTVSPRVTSYKILMVFPSHSHSHLIIGSSVLKGLAKAGHNVTMISSFPQKESIPNYRDVFLEIPTEFKGEIIRFKDFTLLNSFPL